jgi:hypothetical protein
MADPRIPDPFKIISATIKLANGPLWLDISLDRDTPQKGLFSGKIFSLGVPNTEIHGQLHYANGDLRGPCDVAGNVKDLTPSRNQHGTSQLDTSQLDTSQLGISFKRYGARIDFSRDGRVFAWFQFPTDEKLKQLEGTSSGSASGILPGPDSAGILAGPATWFENP